jgi:hypothetical protein
MFKGVDWEEPVEKFLNLRNYNVLNIGLKTEFVTA